jgi:hypothetical protein
MALLAAGLLTACGDKAGSPAPANTAANKPETKSEEEHGHAHDEVPLGTFDIGGISVIAAQGHGKVEAGKEGHLVIKLPYSDKGASTVRAWIGSEDRTLSEVGKGDYAPSHDDYDIHAVAADPLPEGAKWWIEIEKPDGSKTVGSLPLLRNIAKK